MKKRRSRALKVTSTVMLACAMVIAFAGCATRHYSINIDNVPNVSRVYIRNAGTTSWGASMSRLQYIDISGFSNRVDIRVVDTNGAVFSRYDVPFDAASFEVTRRDSEPNLLVISLLGIAIGIPFLVLTN